MENDQIWIDKRKSVQQRLRINIIKKNYMDKNYAYNFFII